MRRLLAALFLLAVPSALLATPILTPSDAPKVPQGSTATITSNVPVTWNLATGSVGVMVSSTTTSFTYRAPAHVTTRQIQGCSMAPDTVYNTRVDALPVHSSSTLYINQFITYQATVQFSIDFPANTVSSNTPTIPLYGLYTNHTVPINYPWPPIWKRNIEGGSYAQVNSQQVEIDGSDHHMMAISTSTCQTFDMYGLNNGDPSSCPGCNTSSVVSYDVLSSTVPDQGIDAAGMPIDFLLNRLDDIRSGTIRHAFRASVSNGYMKTDFMWPAVNNNYSNSGVMPFGARMRLKSSFDIPGFCSGKNDPAACTTILTALKNYGVFIVDGTLGGVMDISGDADLAYDPSMTNLLYQMSDRTTGINVGANFEVVDESSLQDPISSPSNPGLAALVPPSLGVNGTVLQATQISDSSTAAIHIINQGITVGFPANSLYQFMQAGSTTTLIAYVTGSTNTAVTWSMSPSTGTLNSATGVYLAPDVVNITTVSITATSNQDAASSATLTLNIFPGTTFYGDTGDQSAGPAAPGTIVNGNYVDTAGHTWWTNFLCSSFYRNGANDDWYHVTYVNNTGLDVYPFFTAAYYLGDAMYRAILKPGNYLVKVFTDYHSDGSVTVPPSLHHTQVAMFDSQGQLAKRYFDVYGASGNQPSVINTVEIPAKVGADGKFYFSARVYNQNYGIPSIDAFMIQPDTGTPRVTMDNVKGEGAHVVARSSSTIGCVAWSGLDPGCTFSIISGPGNLIVVDSTTVTYVAPVNPPPAASPQTITIGATSTSDVTKSSSTTLVLAFGVMGLTQQYASMPRQMTQQFSATSSSLPYTNVTWSANYGVISSTGFYTAPNVSNDTAVTVTATSTDDVTQSTSTVITVTANAMPLYWDLGDNYYPTTDSAGHTWKVQQGNLPISVSGESISFTCPQTPGNNCNYNQSGGAVSIGNLVDPLQEPLYQHAQYGYPYNTPLGDIDGTIHVPTGKYKLTLKFADYGSHSVGYYGDEIVLNGTTLVSNYDFVAAAGGTPHGATDLVYNVTFTTLDSTLNFNHVGGALPQVNAISLEYQGPLSATSTVIKGTAKIKGSVGMK